MPASKKPATLHPDIAEVLLTDEQIRQRIKSLAQEIKQTYGDGEFTIIPTAIKGDGQELTLPFHLIQEAGQWRVDMVTTMDKLMGGLMGMMEQAMGSMAEGMGKMMEGVGQAMSEAFEGMSAGPTSEEKGESNGDSSGRKRQEME